MKSELSFLFVTSAQPLFMPFKIFKLIYSPAGLNTLLKKDLHIKDTGGNDLDYKSKYLVYMHILGRKVMHALVILESERTKFWELISYITT
jgi:hypothetical protein